MKERSIIFSAPMVRALLEGRKTQTRRIVNEERLDRSPYGERGDRLWVRETWHTDLTLDARRPGEIAADAPLWYPADGGTRNVNPDSVIGKKRSVLFMPRRASRLTLVLDSVRIERLQDITAGDARAEGSEGIDAYHSLWDGINAPRGFSWAENPRVWVVEFKRVPG